jgi:hypothetical protein
MKIQPKEFLSKIEPVRQRLQAWRRARKHLHEPIPQSLWKAMAQLARTYGVSRISHALRVEYYPLKQRAQSAEGAPEANRQECPFVQLEVPAPTSPSGCIVELENGSGTRMTLRLAPGAEAHLLALVQALWRKEP